MTQSAIQAKQITPTQHGVVDPHPAQPIVTQTNHTEERCIPETYYLTAVDPTKPAEPDQHLHILLIDHSEEAPIWLDLLTNNSRFAFVCAVVRDRFKRHVCIYGTRPADEPF